MMDILSQLTAPIGIHHYLFLSAILFSIGVMGVLLRRNFIVIFMSIELMLNAVNILLVAFSRFNGNQSGQVFVFFIMVVAAAEVAVGLGILVMIYRNIRSVDINALKNLKW
jgi:NADH-quinone oxidoreductase subunit K